MKIFSIILLIVATISMASCATLFTGTKQTIQINSKPSGAKVQVNGIDRGRTPTAVRLKKGEDGQLVTLKVDGFKAKTFQPETGINIVAALNLFNIFFWGLDAVTGALWKYDPKFYEIELEPKKVDNK